VRKRG